MKNRIPFLPGWAVLRRSYAFKDIDSATAIEQTAKIYKAMQELIEDYNKFVEELNKSFEEHITLTEQDQECFKKHIEKICHDYIRVMDMHSDKQDRLINDAILFMKDNLSESISTTIANMRESGEMNEVILAGLEDIKSTLQTQAGLIETNANNITTNKEDIADNKHSLSLHNTRINTLEQRTGDPQSLNIIEKSSLVNAINYVNGTLTNKINGVSSTVGELSNLEYAELTGDDSNVISAINAVNRKLDEKIDDTNETITNLSGNVYTKNNYAVVEGTMTSAFTTAQYPSGFNRNNCIVLNCCLTYNSENTMDQYISMFDVNSNNIKSIKFAYSQNDSGVYIANTYYATDGGNAKYKIVLLKYKD